AGAEAAPVTRLAPQASRRAAAIPQPPGASARSLSPRGLWAAAAAREDPDVHAVLAHVATGLVLVAVVEHELEPVGVSGDQGSVADQVVHAPACLGAVGLVGGLDAGLGSAAVRFHLARGDKRLAAVLLHSIGTVAWNPVDLRT